MSAALIARLYAQRETWCELQPGVRVRLRRPAEAEMPQFYRGVTLAAVQAAAVAWDGITEALLMGAAIGSSDPLEFDADAWAVIVADRSEWVEIAARHIAAQIDQHLGKQDATAGNSAPSSTPAQA